MENEQAEYLLDDIWAELEDLDVLRKVKIITLVKKYGEAYGAAAVRAWKRGIE